MTTFDEARHLTPHEAHPARKIGYWSIGTHKPSLALAGAHWYSLALTGTHWYSLALTGTH